MVSGSNRVEKIPVNMKRAKISRLSGVVRGLSRNHDSRGYSHVSDESVGATPDVIGKKLCEIVDASSPKHRYLVGAIGQTIAVTLKSVLPGGLFEKLMNDHYGIKKK